MYIAEELCLEIAEYKSEKKELEGRGMLMSVKSHLETFGGAFLMISRNEDGN